MKKSLQYIQIDQSSLSSQSLLNCKKNTSFISHFALEFVIISSEAKYLEHNNLPVILWLILSTLSTSVVYNTSNLYTRSGGTKCRSRDDLWLHSFLPRFTG